MEPEETPLRRICWQIYSFLDREMSMTLVWWINIFLTITVLKLLGLIHDLDKDFFLK
jgi:hypothetical protein